MRPLRSRSTGARLALGTALLAPALGAGSACYRAALLPDTPAERLAWSRAWLPADDEPRAEAPCPEGEVDEATLVRLAVDGSAEIAARQADARALDALAEVSLADAPELRLTSLRLDRLLHGPARAELALRVPVERPGTLSARADALRHEAALGRAEAAEAARELALEVRLAYARWTVASELVDKARAAELLARAEAERLGAARKGREASEGEVLAAELAQTAAEGELVLAQAEAERWRSVLAARAGWAGRTGPGPACAPTLTPRSDAWIATAKALLGEADLRGRALSQRPGLAALAARLARGETHAYEARAAMWPWLSWVQLGYEVDGPLSGETWGFALAVDVPIGAWGGAALDAADAERRGLEQSARVLVAEVLRELEASVAELRAQLALLEQLEARDLAPLRSRVEAQRAAARAGQADPADVDDLERDLLRLEGRRLEARRGLGEALARLRAALGETP